MEYTVAQLAKLAGVSPRTLRYYDAEGLLCPQRREENGYRTYGQHEVDLLQQILFYRELGMSLEQISGLIASPEFDRVSAMEGHLASLCAQRERLDALIATVRRTVSAAKGEIIMSDEEKFEAFKQQKLRENREQYGEELRARFGAAAVDASDRKVAAMDSGAWQRQEELSAQINRLLAEAVAKGDPASEEAQRLCELHARWLQLFWGEGTYSRAAHLALGEGYVADERFRAYYEKAAPGGAVFLRDALRIYCRQ